MNSNKPSIYTLNTKFHPQCPSSRTRGMEWAQNYSNLPQPSLEKIPIVWRLYARRVKRIMWGAKAGLLVVIAGDTRNYQDKTRCAVHNPKHNPN